MTTEIDLETELAILELLAEDIRAVSFTEAAERIQLNDLLIATTPETELVPNVVEAPSDDNFALSLFTMEAQVARDQAFSELLQSQDATVALSRQYAQRLAAAEQKLRMDSEFAAKLQVMFDQGVDNLDGYDADR